MDDVAPKVSYRNKLMGSQNSTDPFQALEDIEVQEGDVKTKVISGIPSIIFSKRVHKFIEKKMAKTVVIKLLRRKITFNAILNIIKILWKTKSPFQLMDLENDYYLVQFNDEEDFKNVLTKGPWVIFGQYLTVRPWLPNFSTAQDEVESQVVYVWLHGLSKGYYSTSILQAIRLAIGPMVKIDDNMENASRGRFRRKGRETNANRGKNQGKSVGGSMFNVLNENHRGDGMAESVMEKERITEKDKGKENRGKTSSKKLASHRKKRVNLKGNGLVGMSGPKVGLKVLKPISNTSGLQLGKGQKGLNNGSKMGFDLSS
ncbi:hypothetical protein Goshw_020312 [Gossypium schwendimanii]|uniref:DUF4283 domain-containing protein n=1 Tax=Gossypium schwendimanii TaxID=34291 RepID=A0A7J9KTI5_GOSSC|nr:hypothetical protein [Gossypium schwendimanii]